jgi:type II secretory pathway component PulM
MQYVIVLAVLAGVFYLISQPLLNARRATHGPGADVGDLRAARDSKLQEIRDAEMDMRTGKLSDDDYQAIDQTLRTEAVEILRRLDEAGERDSGDGGSGPGEREDGDRLPSPR